MLVRALCPDDAPALAEGFEQLSEASRYRRFFTAKPHLSEQSLAFLTAIDHHDHEALVAVEPDSGQLLGVARFIRDPREPDHAEVAVTVADSWQRRGLGTASDPSPTVCRRTLVNANRTDLHDRRFPWIRGHGHLLSGACDAPAYLVLRRPAAAAPMTNATAAVWR